MDYKSVRYNNKIKSKLTVIEKGHSWVDYSTCPHGNKISKNVQKSAKTETGKYTKS